jgi:hypothetical protein
MNLTEQWWAVLKSLFEPKQWATQEVLSGVLWVLLTGDAVEGLARLYSRIRPVIGAFSSGAARAAARHTQKGSPTISDDGASSISPRDRLDPIR